LKAGNGTRVIEMEKSNSDYMVFNVLI